VGEDERPIAKAKQEEVMYNIKLWLIVSVMCSIVRAQRELGAVAMIRETVVGSISFLCFRSWSEYV
jgi:hypothetical protein